MEKKPNQDMTHSSVKTKRQKHFNTESYKYLSVFKKVLLQHEKSQMIKCPKYHQAKLSFLVMVTPPKKVRQVSFFFN